MRTFGVHQKCRFVEGSWLHRMSPNSIFFLSEITYFISYVLSYHLISVDTEENSRMSMEKNVLSFLFQGERGGAKKHPPIYPPARFCTFSIWFNAISSAVKCSFRCLTYIPEIRVVARDGTEENNPGYSDLYGR